MTNPHQWLSIDSCCHEKGRGGEYSHGMLQRQTTSSDIKTSYTPQTSRLLVIKYRFENNLTRIVYFENI